MKRKVKNSYDAAMVLRALEIDYTIKNNFIYFEATKGDLKVLIDLIETEGEL